MLRHEENIRRDEEHHQSKMDPNHANYDRVYAAMFVKEARKVYKQNNRRRRDAIQYWNSESRRLLPYDSWTRGRREVNFDPPPINESDLYEGWSAADVSLMSFRDREIMV